MSKVVKGAGSAIKKAVDLTVKFGKNVISGIKNAFDAIWESPVGKIVIVAAAVYFGGWALGYWGQPAVTAAAASSTATTTAATTASTTAAGTGAAAGAGTGAAVATGAGTVTPTVTSSAAPAIAAGGAGGAAAPVGGGLLGAATPVAQAAAPTAAEEAALTASFAGNTGASGAKGIFDLIQGMSGGLLDFARANPIPTLVAAQGLGSALTPSAAEEAAEAEKQRQRRAERNWQVGDIDLSAASAKPTDGLLKDSTGKPIFGEGGRLAQTRRRVPPTVG